MGKARNMNLDKHAAAPAWIGKLAIGLCVVFLGLSVALAFLPSGREPVHALAAPVSDRPTLLVYESASCGWCRHFRAAIAPDYVRSHLETRAPLKYLDVSEQRRGNAGYRLNGRIVATPTFVLVDRGGREVDRLRGVPGGHEVFAQEIERMLGRMSTSAIN